MILVARLAALLLLVGCGGRTAARSSSGEATIDGAALSRLEGGGGSPFSSAPGANPDVTTLGAGASDGGGPDVEDVAVPGLSRGPTVWIGQSDKTVTYPPGWDGGPSVLVDDYPFVMTPEKVVLILNASASPLVGTITFGDDAPPPPATDPTQDYPPEPTRLILPDGATGPFAPFAPALGEAPFPGFSYSLVSSSLSGSILYLAFAPNELFQSYCVLQHPQSDSPPQQPAVSGAPCVCDGGVCGAETSPLRRFELTVNGNTMQGQLSYFTAGFLGGTANIRLQRVE